MPIIKPKNGWSKKQKEKAATRCLVRHEDDHYVVHNLETGTEHRATESSCDCTGFKMYENCYHILAIKLHLEREAGKTAQEVMSELFDF